MISRKFRKSFLVLIVLSVCSLACKQKQPAQETPPIDHTASDLKAALTFYASFDSVVEADFALGDKKMYTVPNRRAKDSAQVGLHKPDILREDGKGKFGAGLVFTERSRGNIYYPSEKNIAYSESDWSGAISFWLRLDPETDLEPGYCDPIQITDVSYNDAAIWVDFTKENPRDFRLGVIGDREVWNPDPEGPDNENPIFIEQLTGVKNPPFGSDVWTHILINFSNLNTNNGKASLYLNGKHQGTRESISTPFTWELAQSNIYLGLGYIGLMDELSIYNRALTSKEIETLYDLEHGVHDLMALE